MAVGNSIYPPLGRGGAGISVQHFAEGLAARGWDAHLLCLSPEPSTKRRSVNGVAVTFAAGLTPAWTFGDRLHGVDYLRTQLSEVYNVRAARFFGEYLDQVKPEIVHVHNFRGFSCSIWDAACRRGVPVVQTFHDYTLVCPRGVLFKRGAVCSGRCLDCRLASAPRRAKTRRLAASTAVSERMIQLLQRGQGLQKASTPVVIHGDNPAGAQGHRREERGGLRFGFLGRLEPIKGLQVALDAWARLGADAPELVVAGEGVASFVGELHQRAARSRRVKFEGYRPAAEVLAHIDVLIVPSIWEEPMGRVIHEGFAAGVPALASRIGGIPELVTDGVTGWLFAPGDAQALEAEVRRLLARPESVQDLRDNCRRAAERFDRDRILDEYERTLLGVLRGRRPIATTRKASSSTSRKRLHEV